MIVTRDEDTLLLRFTEHEPISLEDLRELPESQLQLGERLVAAHWRFRGPWELACDMDIEDDGGRAAKDEARRQMGEMKA